MKKKNEKEQESLSERFWKDILALEEHPEKAPEILGKYRGMYAVGRLTITSFDVLWRFRHLNQGKPYGEQIKPYNFITVGLGYYPDAETGDLVIPMLPYVKHGSPEFAHIPNMPFVDYRTGKTYDNRRLKKGQLWTKSYWLPLAAVVKEYPKHAEAKSVCTEDTRGKLERRQVIVDYTSIRYIGKETNKLEVAEVIGADPESYTEYVRLKELILELPIPDALKAGISRRNISYMKKCAREGKPFLLKKATKKKLMKATRRKTPLASLDTITE